MTVRVRLTESSVLSEFVDSQTHLVVTHEPAEVDVSRVGAATRARLDIEIVPVAAPAELVEASPSQAEPELPETPAKSSRRRASATATEEE